VAFGRGHPLVYLYNIVGWSSFSSIRPVIRPVIHPSKFLIPEEEDDFRVSEGHGYPLVLTIIRCMKNEEEEEEHEFDDCFGGL
jgi:hypothetical protein